MPPVVLGIDTSGTWCSAALLRGAETWVRRAEVGNAHSEQLLAMVGAVLTDASLGLADCDAIAFGAGPGSFTGLRIACAAAQGLAFGAGRRVAAIGTLDAIAHAVVSHEIAASTVLVAQDARMGEVYWALFERVGGTWSRLDEPALATVPLLRATLRERGVALPVELGCGNAWALHGSTMDGLASRVAYRAAADAVDVAWLGREAMEHERLIDPADAAPVYVRNDVARTTAERAAARQAALS